MIFTYEQKCYLKFMVKYLDYDLKQCLSHPSLHKPDGSKHLQSTVRYWFKKIKNNEGLTTRPTGRPLSLSAHQQSNLISIMNDCK